MEEILLGTLERLERCFTTFSIKPPSHENTFKTAFQTFQCSKLYNLNNKKQCISFYYLFMFAVIETVVIVVITNHFILSERTTQKPACNITTF